MEIAMHGKREEILKTDTGFTMMPPATVQRMISIVGESKQNQVILQQAISNVVSTFGQPVMKTILWHLKTNGVILNSGSDINIPVFYKALQQITGDLVEEVMSEICANLDRNCHDHSISLPSNSHLPIVSA